MMPSLTKTKQQRRAESSAMAKCQCGNVAGLGQTACRRCRDRAAEMSPEDRASLFIEWCALHGLGLEGWPEGAYEQLVSHIRGDYVAYPA
jgi:hypothetical protein